MSMYKTLPTTTGPKMWTNITLHVCFPKEQKSHRPDVSKSTNVERKPAHKRKYTWPNTKNTIYAHLSLQSRADPRKVNVMVQPTFRKEKCIIDCFILSKEFPSGKRTRISHTVPHFSPWISRETPWLDNLSSCWWSLDSPIVPWSGRSVHCWSRLDI